MKFNTRTICLHVSETQMTLFYYYYFVLMAFADRTKLC